MSSTALNISRFAKIYLHLLVMWVKQSHKPPMTGNGLHQYATYKHGDWGMVNMTLFHPRHIVCLYHLESHDVPDPCFHHPASAPQFDPMLDVYIHIYIYIKRLT